MEQDDDISLEDLHSWDSQLFNLASYEVTGGLMVMPSSMDESMELQKTIFKKFNYFKRLVQLGEMTVEQIHEYVFRKNGAIFGLDKKKNKEENVDELVKRIDIEDQKRKEQEVVQLGVNSLVRQLLTNLQVNKENIDSPIKMLLPLTQQQSLNSPPKNISNKNGKIKNEKKKIEKKQLRKNKNKENN